ncbi:unnamed protein product [Withania somnifera]
MSCSYLCRVCMAASVAMVEGQIDHSSRYTSKYRPVCQSPRLPFGSTSDNVQGEEEEGKRKHILDESVQQVMFLNCWTHS